MIVQFVDLTRVNPTTLLTKVFKSELAKSNFILGRSLDNFERNFGKYLGVKHCIGVASGLDALVLSLRALGIKPGDEVITQANSFIATAMAISITGASSVLIDVNNDGSLNVDKIESAISKKTRAIIPVHLYGRPAEMDKITQVAKRYRLYVVEDACQAHGAIYNNNKVGSFGHINSFSFYPTKNLGCLGDGGAITTNDDKLARKVRLLRNYGSDKKYTHRIIGYNSRLDTLQAAILDHKLIGLDAENNNRISVAEKYRELLSGIGDLTLPGIGNSVFHLYVIKTKKRDALASFLSRKGIVTAIHYPVPIHLQPVYKKLGYKAGDFPVTERLAKESLSLPMFPKIRDSEIKYVAAMVRKFYRNEKN